MAVVQYSRRDVNGLYDIKVCTNQGCTVEVGFYKIKNPVPSGQDKQVYSFPSTTENDYFFVPSRVVEDPSAFQTYVLDATRRPVSCLVIDPCNVHTQLWCCEQEEIQETSDSSTNDILSIILIYVLFGLLGLSLFAAVAALFLRK